MVAAIGGFLTYVTDKFDIWLAGAGLLLTIIAFYFTASFKEILNKIGRQLDEEIQEILGNRKLRQRPIYCLFFLILIILWLYLIIKKCNNWVAWLVGAFAIIAFMIIAMVKCGYFETKQNWLKTMRSFRLFFDI